MTNLPPFGTPLPSGALATTVAVVEAPLFVSAIVAFLVCAVIICVGVYRANRPALRLPTAPRKAPPSRFVEVAPSVLSRRATAGGGS